MWLTGQQWFLALLKLSSFLFFISVEGISSAVMCSRSMVHWVMTAVESSRMEIALSRSNERSEIKGDILREAYESNGIVTRVANNYQTSLMTGHTSCAEP